MQSNPMFCTDAAAVFDHLFEDEAILELRTLIEDDIDVEVAVADVSVPEGESACLFSEVGEEVGPCSDIEGDVVGQDLFFLSDGGDGDISLIFQILLYYLSLLDMSESLYSGSASNNSSRSSVAVWTKRRWSSSPTVSKMGGWRCLVTVW